MRGFTIVEIVLAITILMIILGTISTAFFNFLAVQEIGQISEDLVFFVVKAREKTMASEGGFNYGVHVGEDRLVIFRAPNYSEGEPTNETLILPGNFLISDIDLQGGSEDIIFQPLTGETFGHGTFTVEKESNPLISKIIRIYETGNAEIQQ